MFSSLKRLVLDPIPAAPPRSRRGSARWLDWGNFDFRYYNNMFDRPNYAYIESRFN
jgi:hypothetical protein